VYTPPSGGDKGQKNLVRELRAYRITLPVARKFHSAVNRRTARHSGYAISQISAIKRGEEIRTNGVSPKSSYYLATIGPSPPSIGSVIRPR
jgi:hypothetical protein